MSHYITVDYRKEVIFRISRINLIRENLKDAEAELEEVKKRDPNCRTKAISESRNVSTGGSKTHSSITLSNKDDLLEIQISEWKTMLNDFNKGWNLLDDIEKTILELRFIQGMSRRMVANHINYSEEYVKKKQASALRIMENNILRL